MNFNGCWFQTTKSSEFHEILITDLRLYALASSKLAGVLAQCHSFHTMLHLIYDQKVMRQALK